MERREFWLCVLCLLLLAQLVSWFYAGPNASLCLIEPEHYEQAAADDNQNYCPTFFAGAFLLSKRGFEWIKRDDNDKAVVAGFTIVLAISTIGLWLATNKLWEAGEKQFGLLSEGAISQAADTHAAIKESARAATAMESVASTIQSNATNQLRAYISVLAGTIIEQTDEVNFEFQPHFFNAGFTPAYDVIVYAKAEVLPFPLPSDFDFSVPENAEASVSVLGFQQHTFTAAGLSRKLSADEIAEIKRPNANRRIYNYGHVTYRDLFGNPRRTNFCFYTIWGSVSPVSMTTRRHNDAD